MNRSVLIGNLLLGLVQNFFAPPSHPIGIDLDGRTIRLAQVHEAGDEFRLRAAACKRWPGQALEADAGAVRELIREGNFAGRDAVLALPATAVRQLHSTIDADEKPAIARLLETLAGAGLRVHGVRPMPSVLHDLSRQLFRRGGEMGCTSLHVHLAESTTLVFIAVADELKYIENIAFSRAIVGAALAGKLGGSAESADATRERLLHASASIDWHFDRTLIHRPAFGQHGHSIGALGHESSKLCDESVAMQLVVATEAGPLVHRLAQLRNSFATPIDRLIFSGAESMDRPLCELIARALQLPAHVADPILRMRDGNRRELAGGIDRRLPQPAWAAAIGASISAGKAVPT